MIQKPLLVSEVSELLQCSEEKASELLNTGELPGLRYGRGWIVPPGALAQRLDELALERAAQLRSAPKPSTLDVVLAATRGRSARVPPALP